MSVGKWNKTIAILCVLTVVLSVPAFCLAASRIGIVMIHGKAGTPGFMANAVGSALKKEGFLLEMPEMPWSQDRYIDKTFEEALLEIDQAIERLRKNGAKKIVIAGHSMGADAALAYAANREGIDGVILLAPGHTPDTPSHIRDYRADVAKAKAMLDAGKGNKLSTFNDWNRGIHYIREMKAVIYYSYFSPDGLGAMSIAAIRMQPDIPVLYVVGTRDPGQAEQGKNYAFDKLPEHKLTRWVTVHANHMETPAAALDEMIVWLHKLQQSEPRCQ